MPDARHEEALVGGFFVAAGGAAARRGAHARRQRRHVPFAAPFDSVRACLHVQGGRPRIAWRHDLPETPRGDLLQAGPLLVHGGAPVFRREEDLEGFSQAASSSTPTSPPAAIRGRRWG